MSLYGDVLCMNELPAWFYRRPILPVPLSLLKMVCSLDVKLEGVVAGFGVARS